MSCTDRAPGGRATDAPAEPRRRVRRRDPDDQQGWGDVPISALEHPYLRLLQVLALAVVVVLALSQLELLDAPEVTLTTTRVSGEDPIAAAAAVARESHGRGAPTVILAGTQALADGVVATGLAGALRAPILLSDAEQLSPATREVMRELDVERTILIGGTNALGVGVEATLAAELGMEVERVAGASRFDTAGQVAQLFQREAEPALIDGLRTALIVPAEDVPAGLEAGSLAAYTGSPLPVLISQNGLLPEPTTTALRRLRIEQLLAVGDVIGFDGPVRRITGLNGAADMAIEIRPFRPPRVVLVPAGDESRTLIAGPLAGREAGVILTSATAEAWLREHCGTIGQLFVIGEPDVITETQILAAENAASNCDP